MLDLTTAFGNQTYEIKLFDGSVLHLQRPTQGIQQTMLDLAPVVKDSTKAAKAIPTIIKVFVDILNRNAEGKTFEVKDVTADYSFEVVMYVINDYFQFWNKEIAERVNFLQAQ